MITVPRYGSGFPPPLNSLLDRQHALSRGMLACFIFAEQRQINTGSYAYSRNYANDAMPGVNGGLNNNIVMLPKIALFRGQTSYGLQPQSGTGYLRLGQSLFNNLTQWSIFCRATGAGNLSHYESVFLDNVNGNGLSLDNSGSLNWAILVGGLQTTVPRSGALGTIDDVVGTYDGTNVRGYRNGSLITTTAQTGSVNTATDCTLMGDASGNTNAMYGGILYIAMAWNRTLTAGEVMALSQNPYQMFYSPARLGYGSISGPGGGATVTMRRSLAAYGARAGSRQVHRS